MLAGVARLGVAADHELLTEFDLELEPVTGSRTGLVRRIRSLRDDAFPVIPTGSCEETFTVAGCAVAESQGVRRTGADEALESSAACRPRLVEQHVVVVHQQVERDECRRCAGGLSGNVV